MQNVLYKTFKKDRLVNVIKKKIKCYTTKKVLDVSQFPLWCFIRLFVTERPTHILCFVQELMKMKFLFSLVNLLSRV